MTEKASDRTAAPEDIPALKALWHTVFGDDKTEIDRFFDVFFSPDLAAAAGPAGAPVSAAYTVPVGALVLPRPDRSRRAPGRYRCAMLYAIATHPDFRGCGYGEAVTREAGRLAVRAGCPAVVLKPASDGLFEFYEKRTAFRTFFETCRGTIDRADLPGPRRLIAAPATPGEYRALRNIFLEGAAYIDMDERALAYQNALCGGAGGLVRLIDADGRRDAGCAVVEPDGDIVRIKELLPGGAMTEEAVAAIAEKFPAEEYDVRTPRSFCFGAKSRFGMLLRTGPRGMEPSLQTVKWSGPAFD
jgi:ribosomal protein S18 acetylase RimI-like enzyme